jgi:hypothetical protein
MTDQQPPPEADDQEHAGSDPWHDGASSQTKPVWQDAEDMETAERTPADEPGDADPPAA